MREVQQEHILHQSCKNRVSFLDQKTAKWGTQYRYLYSKTKKTNKFQTYLKEIIVQVHSQYNGFGCIKSNYYLLKNKDDKDICCFFCRQLGLRKRTRYSCIGCNKGFCVNCFTAYHYEGVLTEHSDILSDLLIILKQQKQKKKGIKQRMQNIWRNKF